MQPVVTVEGILRFQKNEIVRRLLDHSTRHGFSLNDIALCGFSKEDHQQLAQLIGYSLSGYADLSYVDDASCAVAEVLAEGATDERDARIAFLEGELSKLREGVRRLLGL